MKLETEFYKLPLLFDATRLAAEVAAIPEESWSPHPQGFTGNDALILVSAYGEINDDMKGPMRPTRHLQQLPYLQQVLASFKTVIGRTRLMRLEGNEDVGTHMDANYYWHQHLRVHVPIVTSPEILFHCGGKKAHMAAGECWVFNTWKLHNVVNPTDQTRIHLVCDTVGSAELWGFMGQAEQPFNPDSPNPGKALTIPFQTDVETPLGFEINNAPVVMTPWEQISLLALIMEDLRQSDAAGQQISQLQEVLIRFRHRWQALWSRFGPRRGGKTEYQACLKQLKQELQPFEGEMHLASNKMEAIGMISQAIIRPALNFDLLQKRQPARKAGAANVAPGQPVRNPSVASQSVAHKPAAGTAAVAKKRPPPPPPPDSSKIKLERPVFIIAAPRSGSSMLFEALARSPDFWTIGGESHERFERIGKLNPEQRGYDSNRLTAEDADPATVGNLREGFIVKLRDAQGNRLANDKRVVRMLEKTPKNALRIPFLNKAFPDARFIWLYREARDNISSILDAWRSGRFITYRQMPGWKRRPWSMLLTPGWRDLIDKSLPEIVANQWQTTVRTVLDDLAGIPADRWTATGYDDFLKDPQAEIKRLCEFAGVDWQQELEEDLPLSQHTLSPPDIDKWKNNAEDLKKVLPLVEATANQAQQLLAPFIAHLQDLPVRPRTAAPADEQPDKAKRNKPQRRQRPIYGGTMPATDQKKPPEEALRSIHTHSFPQILNQIGASLAVSTYQAGKLVLVRSKGQELNTHFRMFNKPMGMAYDGMRLSLGTGMEAIEFYNMPDAAKRVEPTDKHDACFILRNVHVTGDIDIHEMAWAADGTLWAVNTRFSCLCTLDRHHSFVPCWRPPFITALSPEDRCHLNGLCMQDGKAKYVTALGSGDGPRSWRDNKANGGILMDIDSGEIIARDLSMPHSPRWYDKKLWVLESGKGSLSSVDPETGEVQSVAELSGFTRGLDFYGPFAFIGLSQVRETAVFSGIPIVENPQERACGIWVVNIHNGETVAFLKFEDAVQEIFAINVLPGIRFPELLQPGDPLMASSYVVPDEALGDVVPAREVEDSPPAPQDLVADVAASEPQDSDPVAATD